jgi:hypothetical protein
MYQCETSNLENQPIFGSAIRCGTLRCQNFGVWPIDTALFGCTTKSGFPAAQLGATHGAFVAS